MLSTNSTFPIFISHHERIKQMKLQTHEVKRLRANAILLKKVSPDTRLEITKKDLGDFTKEVLLTLQYKKSIKSMLLVLVETDKENE